MNSSSFYAHVTALFRRTVLSLTVYNAPLRTPEQLREYTSQHIIGINVCTSLKTRDRRWQSDGYFLAFGKYLSPFSTTGFYTLLLFTFLVTMPIVKIVRVIIVLPPIIACFCPVTSLLHPASTKTLLSANRGNFIWFELYQQQRKGNERTNGLKYRKLWCSVIS